MIVGSVIILYHPQPEAVAKLIETLLPQVDHLCLVDNSSVRTDYPRDNTKIHYFHCEENVGIAAAQNIGLKTLRDNGCDYGFLFDQDSTITDSFVSDMMATFTHESLSQYDVIAIGPSLICEFSQLRVKSRLQRPVDHEQGVVLVNQIIASGMLIDLSKLSMVGLKDESLFIDGVDHEWCWRASERNFPVALTHDVVMHHRLGDSRGRFMGVTYKVGAPIRLYYQFRNILLLSRRRYVPTYWKARNLLFLPLRFFANAILQKQRRERLGFMLRGLIDGIRGRNGSFNQHWHRK